MTSGLSKPTEVACFCHAWHQNRNAVNLCAEMKYISLLGIMPLKYVQKISPAKHVQPYPTSYNIWAVGESILVEKLESKNAEFGNRPPFWDKL